MFVYKLTIEYEGSYFLGFQVQRKKPEPTVQGALEEVLGKIFDERIKIYCAGRTDTGVHALNQVIHFTSEREFDLNNLHRALDGLLPPAVSIHSIEFAPRGFHARHSATRRRYLYVVDNSPHPSALLRNRAYWFSRKLNLSAMREAAEMLQGYHNFKFFIKDASRVENTEKTMEQMEIKTGEQVLLSGDAPELNRIFGIRPGLIFFYFTAPSFAHSLIRILVGNLLHVGVGRMTVDEIRRMLELDPEVRSRAFKIPGRGLYLLGVDYD